MRFSRLYSRFRACKHGFWVVTNLLLFVWMHKFYAKEFILKFKNQICNYFPYLMATCMKPCGSFPVAGMAFTENHAFIPAFAAIPTAPLKKRLPVHWKRISADICAFPTKFGFLKPFDKAVWCAYNTETRRPIHKRTNPDAYREQSPAHFCTGLIGRVYYGSQRR